MKLSKSATKFLKPITTRYNKGKDEVKEYEKKQKKLLKEARPCEGTLNGMDNPYGKDIAIVTGYIDSGNDLITKLINLDNDVDNMAIRVINMRIMELENNKLTVSDVKEINMEMLHVSFNVRKLIERVQRSIFSTLTNFMINKLTSNVFFMVYPSTVYSYKLNMHRRPLIDVTWYLNDTRITSSIGDMDVTDRLNKINGTPSDESDTKEGVEVDDEN